MKQIGLWESVQFAIVHKVPWLVEGGARDLCVIGQKPLQ